MQKLIYPCTTMNITQNYNGKYSHYGESHDNKYVDYPIDEACSDGGREWFYAPCDVIVKRIYGVGNRGTNTIWLESTDKVKLANGDVTYITIRVTHPEDDDLSKLKVGKVYKRGTPLFREGKDGWSTGNHFHICVSTCKFKELLNNGWVKNNNGYWVTYPKPIKPENAFFIDKNYTIIKNDGGLNFTNIETKQVLKLPKTALSWRVYPLNKEPRIGNECGKLKPYKYGGLEYEILGWKNKNVCIIETRDFGKVQIYVALITGAKIIDS